MLLSMNELELNKDAFNKAVIYFGGQKKLGNICGFCQQAASKFSLGQLKKFRPDYALRIQKASNGDIKCNELMPHYDWSTI